jgi:hypothetical protein
MINSTLRQDSGQALAQDRFTIDYLKKAGKVFVMA